MSILNIQYHLSDARSEPVPVRRASSPRPRPQPPVVENDHELYQFSPLDDDDDYYSPPRRVLSRGEMEDGSIAVNHSAVERYLRCLKGSLQVSESWHRGSPMGWPWHTFDGRCMTWWHAEKAGIVGRGDSWSVCHRSVEGTLDMVGLQRSTIKAIFALAALAVMRAPRDSVFWAFWGLKSAERTAELVDEVLHTHPPLITLPRSVVWADKASALAAVEESRRPLLPKAVPPIQFISSNLHLLMQDPKPAGSAKRKRLSADVDDGQPVAKRLRTRIAKPKVPVGPPRKSTRLRKSANTAALAQPGPAHQVDGAEETGPGGAEESVDVDADVVVDVETVAETQARAKTVTGPKKARRATKKLTSRKATSARKARAKKIVAAASPNDAVDKAPQHAVTQPSPPSSGSICIPARMSSSSPTCAASLPLCASAAGTSSVTTAVGTPTPLEDDTRVNTPNVAEKEPPLELQKVDAKLTAPPKGSARKSTKASSRPSQAPARISARIRQKAVTASAEGA